MEKEELYEMLDITDGSEFTYFENIAELLESDKEIPADLIYELLQDVDPDVFAELSSSYFDQLEESVPDNEDDFYTLLENIKNVISGMAASCASEEEGEEYDKTIMELSDEVAKFHDWFTEEGKVPYTNTETGETGKLSVRDALYQIRASKLTDESYEFDFSGATDYELSDFVMSFSDYGTEGGYGE